MTIATLEEVADSILRLTYGDMLILAKRLADNMSVESVDADRMAYLINSWAEDTASDAEATS